MSLKAVVFDLFGAFAELWHATGGAIGWDGPRVSSLSEVLALV